MPKVVISAVYVFAPNLCICCGREPSQVLTASPGARNMGFSNPFEFKVCDFCAGHLLVPSVPPDPERGCECDRYLLHYRAGERTEHTFFFESERYAAAFAAANKLKKKNVISVDLGVDSDRRFRFEPLKNELLEAVYAAAPARQTPQDIVAPDVGTAYEQRAAPLPPSTAPTYPVYPNLPPAQYPTAPGYQPMYPQPAPNPPSPSGMTPARFATLAAIAALALACLLGVIGAGRSEGDRTSIGAPSRSPAAPTSVAVSAATQQETPRPHRRRHRRSAQDAGGGAPTTLAADPFDNEGKD